MVSYHNVVIAGFGGQGVMLIGNLLAQAGMEAGRNVTYFPVYGAEMRGGTANCTVVISEELVGSPVVISPLSTIIMNQPSLDKFQHRICADGVQIVNTSMIEKEAIDPSKKTVCVPANELADKIGNIKGANMVALGAFLKATGCLSLDVVISALERVISSHYHHLIPSNIAALEAGYTFYA
ncbi:2-oxoacid:acceptor oxidoreductase family protein [Lawsonia intracellularis]|uniref:Ferredoxin oxidoreductases, gamma subunit n=1 Tax=Lawsonia intracellularis (strain PHE/MN1-00) TaxID=363253 RepID=Q1MQ81_LAWIP|nr:2-oxoacid:acceptor oxidoreductase family protein [Lawsonia intracellularis]AGC50215.1 pyruvate ferredoxin/flavodoxin oxidoreductase [Lawsonia intracellularis N343]KAA0204642.1 2-oxoacid:ferredoxin oxidoreductase subunit gamma [Lawsonia intracellularis]MBZ3892656.1 2-oxoacid:acceptor oxidoreductase family protein [Lawsonia intracellularis]OMQ03061.1 2-oxoacid:ferredoxin oxidoreductase subunit gamma [Lawsonia intracellularis]RBN33177.1 2-oxoacid:ferredoxin oxidoreductase subunit gamma [Lawson